jgi:hypothetical protein
LQSALVLDRQLHRVRLIENAMPTRRSKHLIRLLFFTPNAAPT